VTPEEIMKVLGVSIRSERRDEFGNRWHSVLRDNLAKVAAEIERLRRIEAAAVAILDDPWCMAPLRHRELRAAMAQKEKADG